MQRYTLMNKNTPVVEFDYDLETHSVTKIADVHDVRYAPPAVLDHKGQVTKSTLNSWWQHRAIPASRRQIQRVLDTLSLDSTLALAERNLGLSLSDRYWIDNPKEPQRWADINFFDNDFTDDLGLLTLGQSSPADPNLMSPNSTLGGDLNKKWTIVDGERILLKAGAGLFNQEVHNEVVATCLHRRLLEDGEYVPYVLHQEGRSTFSACRNMLAEDEELVSAWDIICNRKKPNHLNDCQFLISCYRQFGLKDIEVSLTKMFTCDYILANSDRHWRNFGVIRNVETLEYTRLAPIFDSGTCLWCNAQSLSLPVDFEYTAKPFQRGGMKPASQLDLFRDCGWFDHTALRGFAEEARAILEQNENIPPWRLDSICGKLQENIDYACRHALDCRQI